MALGARTVPGWSSWEEGLAQAAVRPAQSLVMQVRERIKHNEDPLGDAYCSIFPSDTRRAIGATYTPPAIVGAMVEWAAAHFEPERIVDPGSGSGRFLVAAGRKFRTSELVGIELDPLAATLARANLAAAGFADRSTIMLVDYRNAPLRIGNRKTLFIGNPPYVRHHLISRSWKRWLTNTAKKLGFSASQLSGLHVHFFLATAQFAKPGDIGVLITASEWLDVNYGALVRDLLLGPLGISSIQVIEPTAEPFPGTAATAVITTFEVGSEHESIGLRRAAHIKSLDGIPPESFVERRVLKSSSRWSGLTRPTEEHQEGLVPLGELFRVHRGQVTGANRVWIAGPHSRDLPGSVLFSTITKARELFEAHGTLVDMTLLKQVIDIPFNLDVFSHDERLAIEAFLKVAESLGASKGFIAQHRKAWWSIGLRQPAPILATYMARRPPAFVVNVAGARHINIAHGLYPLEPMPEAVIIAIADYLGKHVSVSNGRTYAGGLTKFEPREMERLLIPEPALLLEASDLSNPYAFETSKTFS